MNVTLTKPQTAFFNSQAKATAAVAGFGSGKSQVAMYRMLTTMIQYPKANMLYSAPIAPLIRDILWPKLEEFLPQLGLEYHINRAEGIVYIHGLGKIYCRSMDNPDRLVGFEVADVFLDELDIMTSEKGLNVYRKAKARMRQKVYETNRPHKEKYRKKNQLFVSTTPEGYRSTYQLFKKNPVPDSALIQMSTYSNPHLPPDYIDDLRASYPPQLIEAYLNGEFVNLVSSPVWASFDPQGNSLHPNTPEEFYTPQKYVDTLLIGADFNVGRGCAVVYIKRTVPKTSTVPSGKILVVADEIYNTFDTPDTIRHLNERYPAKYFPKRFVFPDASGTNRKSVNATISDISLMKQNKFLIKKPNKNPPIKDRVASMNAALYNSKQETKIYFTPNTSTHPSKTPNLVDALIQQVYDNNGLPKKGENEFDDMTDAASYPISYMYPIKRNRMFTKNLGGT